VENFRTNYGTRTENKIETEFINFDESPQITNQILYTRKR